MKYLIILLTFCVSLAAAPFMTDNYIKGREIAEGYNLPIALIFTGSDWSKESQELLLELEKSEHLKEMVLVQIDFPELNVQPQEILEQNHSLRTYYNIHSFPTVVLVSPEQTEITRVGYPLQGESNFILHIKNLSLRYQLLKKRFEKARKDRDSGELSICFQEARDLGCNALSKEIIDFGTDVVFAPKLALEKYTALVGAGKKEEAKLLRTKLIKEGEQETLSRIALLDFQQEESVEPIEAFLEKYSQKQADHFWRMHLVISEFLYEQDQKEEALEHAQVSYRYAPPEDKENISAIISKMLH